MTARCGQPGVVAELDGDLRAALVRFGDGAAYMLPFDALNPTVELSRMADSSIAAVESLRLPVDSLLTPSTRGGARGKQRTGPLRYLVRILYPAGEPVRLPHRVNTA